jgi:iron complex outermembrane receptor protein
LALQADGKYETQQYFTTFNAPVDRVPSRLIANARASYAFDVGDSSLEVALFARNVTDELYAVYEADVSALGFAQITLAPPRVIGGEVTVRF